MPIEGWPVDMAGAIALASQKDRYHFQDWAVIQVGGRPVGGERKKGADRGVDGVIPFIDGTAGPKRGVISVKSGNTGAKDVRDLAGVVARDDDVAFGVFVCLNSPAKPMIDEALSHGVWVSDWDGQTYPVIQILCAQDLIDHREVKMPQGTRTAVFAQAAREKRREGVQGRLA
ncbi:MAG: restriction endonuclease [Hyphomicrobiales bacterium]